MGVLKHEGTVTTSATYWTLESVHFILFAALLVQGGFGWCYWCYDGVARSGSAQLGTVKLIMEKQIIVLRFDLTWPTVQYTYTYFCFTYEVTK